MTAGGVSSLEKIGVCGVVIGKALYEGKIKLGDVLEIAERRRRVWRRSRGLFHAWM